MRSVVYRVLAGLFAVVAFAEGLDHALETAAPHRIHLLGHTVVSAILVIALLSQVLASRPPAGLQLLAVAGIGAGLGDAFGARFGGLELFVAVFLAVLVAVRPARAELWERPAHADRTLALAGLLLLLVIAPYFVHQSSLQRRLVDPVHRDYGYWSWAATAPLVLAGSLLAASLKAKGWQLLVGVTSAGLLAFGLMSLALPHEPASWGVAGGSVAIVGAAITAWLAGSGRTLRRRERRFAPAS